jgi:hypothetical protein
VAADDPATAVQHFVDPIQRALGCFVVGKVTADRYEPGAEGVLALNGGSSSRLSGRSKLSLSVSMRYLVVEHPDPDKGPWKVSTTGWMYELQDADQGLLAAYHWHPISSSHIRTPHLHVPGRDKPHLPTRRVMIEDILRYAMEVGAAPHHPETWAEVDAANREAFARGATWGVGPTKPA